MPEMLDNFTNVIFLGNVSIKVCIAQFQKKTCAVLYFLRFIHKKIKQCFKICADGKNSLE